MHSPCSSPAGSISIHALREEGDFSHRLALLLRVISIHALREEGDAVQPPPAAGRGNFYPRPPRGGRLPDKPGSCSGLHISIHALREEGDPVPFLLAQTFKVFLSTPSARRATLHAPSFRRCYRISIHALREEGDTSSPPQLMRIPDFYPRPPRGGRHGLAARHRWNIEFLSTPSARRATVVHCRFLSC